LISYPLYLWHWPLLSLAYVTDVNHYDRPLRVFLVGLSVLLAWCTHRFLELPIRGRAVGVKQAIVLSSLLALLGGLGFITYSNEGFITRVIAQRYVGVTDAFNDWAYPKGLTAALEDRYTNYLSSQEPPVIAFIGDSHIEQFGPRVVSLTQKDRFSPSVFITEGGCPPIPNVFEASHPACNDYISRIKSTLSKYPSIKTLVIGGCWNCYFELEAYSEPDSNKFNYYYSQTDEKIYFRKAAGVQRSIDSLAQFLKTLSLDYRVYLLLDNPLDKNNNPRSLINNRFTMSESSAARRLVVLSNTQLALNNRLKTIATAAGAEYIDQLSSLCPSNKCSTTTSDGVPIYKDDHHLRPFFVIEHAHYLDFLNLKVTGQR
jgi:hypothetical protein